ncbi:MAG TPA: class I SAM-dependent methyltransferase [Thermoanaerobaculia bacterium]|nr:class I SAM-dependent methyltransferase [Thermoanaerobaculia bacterium]
MKTYDRTYFDRWYRNPRTRITSPEELRRRAGMIVATAEVVLGRRVETVLDVGCGEGRWRAPLLTLRPSATYLGLETSEYAVERFGRPRNIRRGSFEDLASMEARPFDLLLCCDVLHYLDPSQIDLGLPAISRLTAGVACLDVTTREDHPSGDLDGWISRAASWYTGRFRRAGLLPCGLSSWMPRAVCDRLGTLDRG